MQVIKNPVTAMQGGGKKYAHYLNFGQPNVATTYPEWGVYVGPIITDSGEAFTYQTLFNWFLGHMPINPALSPAIRGVPATGRYNDYDVCALILKGWSLSFVASQNNTMRPVIELTDFDDFEFIDSAVEI